MRGGLHRPRETRHRLAREHRRQRPALRLPLFALDAQQPIAEARGQHAPLQRILAIVGSIFEQDVTDGRRLMDQQYLPDRKADRGNRFGEVLFAPAFERIALQGCEQLKQPQGLAVRFGRGRSKKLPLGHLSCH